MTINKQSRNELGCKCCKKIKNDLLHCIKNPLCIFCYILMKFLNTIPKDFQGFAIFKYVILLLNLMRLQTV